MIPNPMSIARAAGIDMRQEPGRATYTVHRATTAPADAQHTRICAPTHAGLVWGSVQVLLERAAGVPVTAGSFDPPYGRRQLHLDAGRHFFPVETVLDLLRLMAWGRLNVLNLHVSENEGYRLPSAAHPEVTSAEHYSEVDVARMCAAADELGITVIPSIDMPGHLGHVLAADPWAQLTLDGQPVMGALDVTDPHARELAWTLLDETQALFRADEVTIGGDEFLDHRLALPELRRYAEDRFGEGARENDVWIEFVNATVERLYRRGIRAGVWNDGVQVRRTIDLHPEAIVHYWTRWGSHMAPPDELVAHTMLNWDADALYFVLKRDHLDRLPTFDSVWDKFAADLYPDHVGHTRIPGTAGATFSIWCDEPDALTSTSVVRLAKWPLMAFASRCWTVGGLRSRETVKRALAVTLKEEE